MIMEKGYVEHELPQRLEGTNIQDRMNQRGAVECAFDIFAAPTWSRFFPAHYTLVGDIERFAVEFAKGRWPDQVLFRNTEMKGLLKTLPPGGV
ncbi:hypothetical protein GSI_12018 [Ganoderma sinense ZZ0214-1]|uniref:Uncharacterized protein n=1 Tax=Ganoderma sinense ZZ0214-1 TaxID=1077348 RepID=A0A2G8RXM7_9APHY|nr:hypothetical protein GSI_12018 [Ganoderma sinense ZZ0214-1]